MTKSPRPTRYKFVPQVVSERTRLAAADMEEALKFKSFYLAYTAGVPKAPIKK